MEFGVTEPHAVINRVFTLFKASGSQLWWEASTPLSVFVEIRVGLVPLQSWRLKGTFLSPVYFGINPDFMVVM